LQGETLFDGKLAASDIKDFESVESIAIEEDAPGGSKPDAHIVLAPVPDKTPDPGATATLRVHAPGIGDTGWTTQILWLAESEIFLVINKKYVVAITFKPAPEPEITNNDGPAAGVGDIEIFLTAKSGGRVAGAEVRLILPGPDGSMEKMPNSLLAVKDGGPEDADNLKNGRVLLSGKITRGSIATGQNFAVDADAKDFVLPEEHIDTYASDGVNSVSLTLIRVQKKP
jgi:hypothetical protein